MTWLLAFAFIGILAFLTFGIHALVVVMWIGAVILGLFVALGIYGIFSYFGRNR